MSNPIDNLYGINTVAPEMAVQATDTSNLVYRASDRYNVNTMAVASNMAPHNIVFHGKNGKDRSHGVR